MDSPRPSLTPKPGKAPALTTRLAQGPEDVRAAQRLRYRVFVEEMGAQASPEDHAAGLERDRFDPHCDHLLLCDGPEVVGAYRLMRADMAARGIGFYSAGEFDLSPLAGRRALELGRSCVARAYRGGVGLHLLWDALGDYVTRHRLDLLFGVASFHGSDIAPLKGALSYLHHHHLAPPALRVRSRAYVPLAQIPAGALVAQDARQRIPPLIRAYLRLGGFVGDGAYIDHRFNTVDVCLIMDTTRMVRRYREYYGKERV